MKRFLLSAATGLLVCFAAVALARAEDDGYTPILDQDHTDGWKYLGDGDMQMKDGVTSAAPAKGVNGLYWYQKKTFANFSLKLEFKIDTAISNSGIFVRIPDPSADSPTAFKNNFGGYLIKIMERLTGMILFNPERFDPAVPMPVHPGEWSECEVTAIGQKYVVEVKGQKVTEYTGNRALSGYIGLQVLHRRGEVHFRNVRIKELPSENAAIAAGAPPKPDATCIQILSEQAPNALEWALAPLDRAAPPDIRQNLTNLREDLLDEAAKKPAASAEAYKLGELLCNDLIETLNERDKMLVQAGYTAVQSKANMGEITDQRLEARRRFTNWPTYKREKDQREELRKEKENSAALERQRPVMEWENRGSQIRRIVDALYANYREAARRPIASK